MSLPAEIYQSKIKALKRQVEDSYKYFKHNIMRYHEFVRFVFASALGANELATLTLLKKPNVEFNILEAYINRLLGEFTQQEPTINVMVADGVHTKDLTPELINTMQVVEDHIRDIFTNSSHSNFEYTTYKDLLAGGFSVAKVSTDYVNPMSFEQKILIERAFDPTMCGFDPLAREDHKGDGQYCFEIIPRTKEEFEEEFGKNSTEGMAFARDIEGFNWSYENQNTKILLVVDLYKKERKRATIAKLSNGHSINKKHYPELLEMWNERGIIEQAPIIIQERTSYLESICRYRFCENKVLGYTETNYRYLPLVFIDGNSISVRETFESPSKQMTKPYVYHAKGIQKLKNFAGQTVASEIETMIQHKLMVALESIPEDYQDAYKNVQFASVLAYNAFYNKNPEHPLPPPDVIQRTPTPPLVEATFLGTDQVTQAILGSYDAQMGIADGRTSGKAIQQGALQSNAAAVPYLHGYVKGLERLGQILLDLIPKYYVTPRSLPTRKANGIRSYMVVNDPSSPQNVNLAYDPMSLQIKVEVGVNTALQKQIALEKIIQLMGASETFAQFINTEGLETLLENVDIRGIDQLKLQAGEFMRKMKEMQAKAAQEPNEMEKMIEAEVHVETMRIAQRDEQAKGDQAIKSAGLAIEQQKADLAYLQLMAEIQKNEVQSAADKERADAEVARDAVELAIDIAKHRHEEKIADREPRQKE